MSNSRAKENVEAEQAQKPVAGKGVPNSGQMPKKAPPTGPENQNNLPDRKGKTWPIWLLSAILVAALAGFAWVLASQLLFAPASKQEANRAPGILVNRNGNPASDPGENSDRKPLSILPDKIGNDIGVTILQKQPETDDEGKPVTLAPIAQGADIASGFAMDLGAANSFLELSRRFADIAAVNGPENFRRLEPRAILRETVSGLEARLLVGPFETRKEAGEACAILVLDAALECLPADFEGELIPRD